MRLNRRSVLLGLGTISATVGGAFGSGAFSSVEATRTVTLSTSDDASALVSFKQNPNKSYATDLITTGGSNSNGAIKIQQSNLNERATTRFEDVLHITNNAGKEVDISVNDDGGSSSTTPDPNNLIGDVLDIRYDGSTIVDSSNDGDNAVSLGAGNSKDFTVVVDLRNGNKGKDISSISEIVFAARTSEASDTN
ncbi:hypothetical protein C435_14778 [Haloarcula marismortui ATCC 33799]|jgi:hypothetical protein|uniref:DUF1102 domain-containing protein n=1 Tax=Haloarcula marismortui ATCC 33799 TaxID=662475 RepID=M0K2F9_9EURY|nr:hypothetical protein C435_14778 [Haloarcula californiae ATCC 33799]